MQQHSSLEGSTQSLQPIASYFLFSGAPSKNPPSNRYLTLALLLLPLAQNFGGRPEVRIFVVQTLLALRAPSAMDQDAISMA